MNYIVKASFLIATLCLLEIKVITADICDLCECYNVENDKSIDNEKNDAFFRINCLTDTKFGNVNVDLENIQWPTMNKSLEAHFNYMQFNHLPKLLGSSMLKIINLDNNLIDTIKNDPFKQCKNLESLSISNNSIHDLPKDFLKSTTLLRHLNLSYNSLSDIDSGVVSHLTKLRSVDLSYNKLKTLSVEIVDMLDNVEILNLKGNEILYVQITERKSQPLLKDLNLANNRLTLVGVTTFTCFQKLEKLDLSNNSIEVIEPESFNLLENLLYLDISSNYLRQLSLALPNVIQHLIISSNHLTSWPLTNFPKTLTHIEIQYNQLTELFSTKWFSNNLKVFNVSNNLIDFLPHVEYSELEILDLSYNAFTAVPHNLGVKAPKLDTLILDHNPIEIVDFVDPIYLRKLSMKNMSLLQDLSDAAFRNVDGQGDCMEVVISHCEILSNIGKNAFRHLDLCSLDLSYNNLSSIPELLTNWTKLTQGIDIQGNPFECNCSEQWMLDIILNHLYLNESLQHLLYNLRVWMCGGILEILPCSRVGHVFRKATPYSFPGGTSQIVNHNNARLVDAWLDEWSEFYYSFNPAELDFIHNYTHCNALLRVNDTVAMSGYQPTWINLLPVHIRDNQNIENSWLHLGGTPQAPISLVNNLVGKPGFTGCMQSLKINGRSLNIYRCAGPETFKDYRFVKYYKKQAAFCNPNSAMRMAPNEVQLSTFGESIGNIHLSLTAGPGCIIVIVLSAICMILFVIVAFKWRNQQRKRLERKRRLFQYLDYEYE